MTPEQRDYSDTMRSSAESLLGLINDILDLSKIDAGKLDIEPTRFDLEIAAEEALSLFSSAARKKGIELVFRYAPGTPREAFGDPGRVRQVLTNLISNAVKFTETGYVLVEVESHGRGDAVTFRLNVTDTGIGVPPERRDAIFEKFVQGDASTNRNYGGTGLGLAISKQLVELMGGEIGLRAGPGSGSTFWFTLPSHVDRQAAHRPGEAPDLGGLRVLIVDDNAVSRGVLDEYVAHWNLRGTSVASGEQALRALREAGAAGDPFDIGLVDVHAAVMDGEILARAIKDDPTIANTVLFLLTAGGQRGDAERMAQAGFAAYLTEPMRPSLLRDALATVSRIRARGEHHGLITRHSLAEREAGMVFAPPAANGNINARVLLVEDNPVNQKVGRLLMEGLGCRIDTAANGKEAVEMLD
ncbi:MAG: ATP-binding protein, partial [Candidatus Binatia bacterium]